MTREEKYEEQLKDLGIWDEAFRTELKKLGMMERELQRFEKSWREEGSDPESKLWNVITVQRRDILTRKETMGLTPKAMSRIKGTKWAEKGNTKETISIEEFRAKLKVAR